MLNLSNKVRINTSSNRSPTNAANKRMRQYGYNSNDHSMVNDPNSSINSAVGLNQPSANINRSNRQSIGEITGIEHQSIDRSLVSGVHNDSIDLSQHTIPAKTVNKLPQPKGEAKNYSLEELRYIEK